MKFHRFAIIGLTASLLGGCDKTTNTDSVAIPDRVDKVDSGSIEVVKAAPSTSSMVPHFVHFRLADSSTIPDSLWYKSPLDSGTEKFTVEGIDLTLRLFPAIKELGGQDSMSIHGYRLGLHLWATIAKPVGYRELAGARTVRTGEDSLAVGLLRCYDSARRAAPGDFGDTSMAGKKAAFEKVVAELVFVGHPTAASYSRLAPVGLDTAKVNRQILAMSAKAGFASGEMAHNRKSTLD